ncbi:unnamed protein product, partial [Symbiodinium microadriaticum]
MESRLFTSRQARGDGAGSACVDEGLIREKFVVARSPCLCENENPKQFLSAYTPQGAYKLNAVDQKYLESLQFPLAQVEEGAKLVALLVTVRDSEMQNMIIAHQEKTWALRQGSAEPDMWLLYEVGARIDQQPDGLILVYVENLLLCGPLWLVRAVSAAIRAVWKASELELLDADHVRFAPKELVTFTALEGENSGNEEEIKQAQKIALRIDLQRTQNLALALLARIQKPLWTGGC